MQKTIKEIRPVVDLLLVQQVKKVYPETKGLTATGVIDWALRKLIEAKKEEG